MEKNRRISFFFERRTSERGITLIALIVTIIVLMILAGISINLMIGENGLIEKAKLAEERYQDAAEEEQNRLDELYSSIKVADSSQVTLTMEELDKYIEEKMKENLFTGTELLREPVVISTSTTAVTGNLDCMLEDSIENYEFLLFTFGPSKNAVVTQLQTLLIPIDKINYSEDSSNVSSIILNECAGTSYSFVEGYFKNNNIFCARTSQASNSARTAFTILSIKGIK